MTRPTIISIEGNIGSGKSTFIKKLEEYYNLYDGKNVYFLGEPVDEWLEIKDEDGEHILSKFYNDQEKYSFSFQMMAYISRLNKLKNAIDEIGKKDNNAIIFTERSLMTDKHVFAQMLYDEQKMEKIDYIIYNKWFDSFNKDTQIDKIIYISSDPKICFERVKLRARNGENDIPLEYLINCSNYHDNMISKVNKKTIKIDGNKNIYKEPTILLNWFHEIDKLISKENADHKHLL